MLTKFFAGFLLLLFMAFVVVAISAFITDVIQIYKER